MTPGEYRELIDFVRDVADNYDCDADAHRYQTRCRQCVAQALLIKLGYGSLLMFPPPSTVRIEAHEEREDSAHD